MKALNAPCCAFRHMCLTRLSAVFSGILAAAALAACGAQPAPHMFGAQKFQATRNGHDYVIYLKGERVEIIRLGYAAPGSHQGIRATMIALIPEVTGCRLFDQSLQGDSGEMRGRVACSLSRGPPTSTP